MKKILLISTIAVFAVITAKAQKPELASAIVHYKFSHLRDTTMKDKPYTENMILFLGQTSSAYKSYDRKMQDALMRKQVADQLAEQKGQGNIQIKVSNSNPATTTEYYSFPLQNRFARKERLITPYLIEEPMPVINWKISADTASFGGLHCQKATGHFKGRDYTAWFCPDLPLHSGPWKLNGLPGLILEAYDKNKEVVFKFDYMEKVTPSDKQADGGGAGSSGGGVAIAAAGTTVKMFGMDDPNVDPNLIAVPTDAVKTTEKEFKNLQEAMKKDPQAFAQSAMAGSGMNMHPAGGGAGPGQSMNIKVGEGPKINNPLELPEKK